MATYEPDNLALLQLASSKGDVYTPSGSTKGIITLILIHNTNTTAETVVINHYNGSTDFELYNMSVGADETVQLEYKGLVLKNGHKITGNTTTASKVTCDISGSERTA